MNRTSNNPKIKHAVEAKALKSQMDNVTQGGRTGAAYNGLIVATMCLIQAWEYDLADAKKLIDYVGFSMATSEVEKWITKGAK